jgi:hypothetical protein
MNIGKLTQATTKVSLKLNKAQSTKLLAGISELAIHLRTSLPVYLQASQKEREELRLHSPVLDAVVRLLEECGIRL